MRLTQRVDDTVGTAAKERYNERGGGGRGRQVRLTQKDWTMAPYPDDTVGTAAKERYSEMGGGEERQVRLTLKDWTMAPYPDDTVGRAAKEPATATRLWN